MRTLRARKNSATIKCRISRYILSGNDVDKEIVLYFDLHDGSSWFPTFLPLYKYL